jgi:hypothetical protein
VVHVVFDVAELVEDQSLYSVKILTRVSDPDVEASDAW